MITAPQFEPANSWMGTRLSAKLPALARFAIAALWSAGVFWGSGFVYLFFPGHSLVPGVLFRLLACTLTGAGYLFLLRVLDYNFEPFSTALGLPLDSMASLQWSAGLLLGGLLIAVDVLICAVFGRLHLFVFTGLHASIRFLAVAVLLLFGALLEELSFRGYPFQKLTEAFGAFWAVVALSALFGAVHLWNPDAQGFWSWGFWNTLGVGVLFALARIRTGSLWLPFGLHFGWNFFQGAIFGLPVSGLREFSTIVRARAEGPAALTGGAYGPEASATCTIVLIAAMPLLWWFSSRPQLQHQTAASEEPSRGI